MTDAGQPPKKAFEPPPWEKEQFDELARRRAEQARADAAIDELVELADPLAPREPEPIEDDEPEPEAPVSGETEALPTAPPAAAAPPGLDERRINAMLLQLSGEETPTMAPIRKASRIIAGIVAAVGTVIVVIAAAMASKAAAAGPLAATSAGVGVIIGAALVGVGVWLWVRANR